MNPIPTGVRATAGQPQGTREAPVVAGLFADLYRELHRIAARQLHRGGTATLGATTLLHEAYVDLARGHPEFVDRNRFFAYAARAMRGLVIDHIRQGHALKRGGEFHLTSLDTGIADSTPEPEGMEHLAAALVELESLDPALAELVDLKFFCGFTFAEIAAQRRTSERTVQRDWQKARLFLHDVLMDE